MNDMLNEALVSGTGKRAMLPLHAAAGKTGTSQSFRDAWFIGYTAYLTTGVWAGNDDGRAMNRVVGGSLPAEIWREIMLGAHAGKPPLPLPGAEPTGADVAAEPVYPQERIADDFIARALGGGAGDTGSIDQLMAR
jgi:penicillin-binding protein 1A